MLGNQFKVLFVCLRILVKFLNEVVISQCIGLFFDDCFIENMVLKVELGLCQVGSILSRHLIFGIFVFTFVCLFVCVL